MLSRKPHSKSTGKAEKVRDMHAENIMMPFRLMKRQSSLSRILHGSTTEADAAFAKTKELGYKG